MKIGASVLAVVVMFTMVNTVHAGQNEVGVVLQEVKGCTIETVGEKGRCTKGAGLVSGSVVNVKNPDLLKIQWISDAAHLEKIGADRYRVMFTPPRDKRNFAVTTLTMLGFLRESTRESTNATTRGVAMKDPPYELPGDGATLLPGIPAIFSVCGAVAGKFIVRDDAGSVVFQRELQGGKYIQLTPEELGIKQGKAYTWEMTDTGISGMKMSLLDSASAESVAARFAELDKDSALDGNDRALAKAGFVQTLSDNYPAEVSLNWFCHQLADSQQQNLYTPQQKRIADYLKARSGIIPCLK